MSNYGVCNKCNGDDTCHCIPDEGNLSICPHCGEECDNEDGCMNIKCPDFTPDLGLSDWLERQYERRQMGIGS